MATYTCAVQRKQIWPDDTVVWGTPKQYVSVIEWDGLPRELGQTFLERFLADSKAGIAPDGFRAVVWAGDRRGEDLDGETGALATIQIY